MPTMTNHCPIIRGVRLAVLLAAICSLSACQLMPSSERDGGEESRRGATPPAERTDARREQPSLERAMELLQDGREGAAERLLVRILQSRSRSTVAELLLAQIQRPPETFLGENYDEIVVQPGDSLSVIAERHADNGLLFYALARLNDIDRPRLLQPGQSIRVPAAAEPEDPGPAEEAPTTAGEEPSAAADSVVTDTVTELLANDRLAQAQSLLLSKAQAGLLEASNRDQLAQVSLRMAREACRDGDPRRAVLIMGQAVPWIGRRAEEGEFAAFRNHLDARLSLREAGSLLGAGNRNGAFESLVLARNLDESIARDHAEEWRAVESALVDHYHGRALSAWRDQEVSMAVTLWERVVKIDPDFEPARIYLERALRAQRELDRLRNG